MLNKKWLCLLTITTISATALLSSCATAPQQESTGEFIDSSAITAKVKAAYLQDDSIKSLPITVKTYKNKVQLSGFVDNTYQRERAEELARSVPGVLDVQDSLVVKSR